MRGWAKLRLNQKQLKLWCWWAATHAFFWIAESLPVRSIIAFEIHAGVVITSKGLNVVLLRCEAVHMYILSTGPLARQ